MAAMLVVCFGCRDGEPRGSEPDGGNSRQADAGDSGSGTDGVSRDREEIARELRWGDVLVHVNPSAATAQPGLKGLFVSFTDTEAGPSELEGERSWPASQFAYPSGDPDFRFAVTHPCDGTPGPSSIEITTCWSTFGGPGCFSVNLGVEQTGGKFGHPNGSECVIHSLAGAVTVAPFMFTETVGHGAVEGRCAFRDGHAVQLSATFELPAQQLFLLCADIDSVGTQTIETGAREPSPRASTRSQTRPGNVPLD